MVRFVAIVALALGLGSVAVPQKAAAAEAVLQAVTVKVNPGKLEEYRQQMTKLRGVLKRIGSKATLRVWNTTAGGADAGQVLVGLEYPDAATWAADSGKVQADAEWQKIQASLAGIRTVVDNSIWRDISPVTSTASAGPTLVITSVAIKPGKLDEYLKLLAGATPISDRLKAGGRTRVWQADFAGAATGAVVVGVEYADLPSYVAAQEKLRADGEWQKLLASFDDVRTVAGRSLHQELAP